MYTYNYIFLDVTSIMQFGALLDHRLKQAYYSPIGVSLRLQIHLFAVQYTHFSTTCDGYLQPYEHLQRPDVLLLPRLRQI